MHDSDGKCMQGDSFDNFMLQELMDMSVCLSTCKCAVCVSTQWAGSVFMEM